MIPPSVFLLSGDNDHDGDDNDSSNALVGVVGVIVSSLVWGSNFIVCKGYELPPDGIHFAWLMSVGILLMGFLSLVTAPLSPSNDYDVLFSPLGLLGGAFWAIGNFLTVPIIRCIGLGVGLAIWAGTNMIVAFGVGSIGMEFVGVPLPREPLAHPSAGICGLICGIVALCLFANIKQQEQQSTTTAVTDNDDPAAATDPTTPDVDGEQQQPTTASTTTEGGLSEPLLQMEEFAPLPPLPNGATQTQSPPPQEDNNTSENDFLTGNVPLGVGMGILAGTFYGFQLVPLSIWNLRISKNGGHVFPSQPVASDMVRSLRFFFSQFTGIFLMSTIGFVLYTLITRNKPKLVSPQATLPSIVCGMVWAIGCGGAMIATCELGNAVGYVLVLNGSFLINSTWSILVFKEIQGERNLKLFGSAFGLIVLSSILISVSKV